MAAETVNFRDKIQWACEGDTKVSLDQKTGELRIRSKSAKVDETFPSKGANRPIVIGELAKAPANAKRRRVLKLLPVRWIKT